MKHAGQPGEQAAQRIDGSLPAVDVDAGKPRRFFVAAQREGVAPQHRLRQDQAGDDGRAEHDQHRVGNVESRE